MIATSNRLTSSDVRGMLLVTAAARARRSSNLIGQMVLGDSVSKSEALIAASYIRKVLVQNSNAVTVMVDQQAYLITGVEVGVVKSATFYGTTTGTTTVRQSTTVNNTAATDARGTTTTVVISASEQEDSWLSSQTKVAIIAVSVVILLIFAMVAVALVVMRYKESKLQELRDNHSVFSASPGVPAGGHYYPGTSAFDANASGHVEIYDSNSARQGDFHYYPSESESPLAGEYLTMDAVQAVQNRSLTPLDTVLTNNELSMLVELVNNWHGIDDGRPQSAGYRDPQPVPLTPYSVPGAMQAGSTTTPVLPKDNPPGWSDAAEGSDTGDQQFNVEDEQLGFQNLEDIIENWSDEEGTHL